MKEPSGSPAPAAFSKCPHQGKCNPSLSLSSYLRSVSSGADMACLGISVQLPAPTHWLPISGNGCPSRTQARDLGLSGALSSYPICHLGSASKINPKSALLTLSQPYRADMDYWPPPGLSALSLQPPHSAHHCLKILKKNNPEEGWERGGKRVQDEGTHVNLYGQFMLMYG